MLESTDGQQRPHEYASLLREHYLSGLSGPAPVAVAAADGAAAWLQQENLFWQSIMNSTTAADFEAYLGQFPDGVYRALAANRLAALRAATGDPDRPRPAAPASVFRDCADCPEMVVVPAGRFLMGCVSGNNCSDSELPVHEVEVASFALSKYEVMFEEYDRFARDTGRSRPEDQGWGRGRRPVIHVSWYDAVAYAVWLSEETGARYRLPSEAEWEYAARAGTTTAYSWGSEIGRNRANCESCGSRWDDDRTAPVGSFAGNAWGLHDMSGNVSEWVEDCRHPNWNYVGAPRDGSAWTNGGDCGLRMLRGSSFIWWPLQLRLANRNFLRLDSRRDYTVGFRVLRTFD